MLIQMPRGSGDQPGAQNADQCNAFEAGLRRDLASAPVVSYDAMLGGWGKRVIDVVLTLIATPIWLPLLLGAALGSKLRHPAPVLQSDERIGYGGRAFKCFSLRLDPPTAKIERLHASADPEPTPTPANDLSAMSDRAEGRLAKWRRMFQRLPMLLNVLVGDMALVGPTPLSPEQLGPLKTAKRYYLSARPGVVGISAIADADEEEATQYKAYALSWSHSTDALILWDALHSLLQRGELWKPSFRLAKARAEAAAAGEAVARRRGPEA